MDNILKGGNILKGDFVSLASKCACIMIELDKMKRDTINKEIKFPSSVIKTQEFLINEAFLALWIKARGSIAVIYFLFIALIIESSNKFDEIMVEESVLSQIKHRVEEIIFETCPYSNDHALFNFEGSLEEEINFLSTELKKVVENKGSHEMMLSIFRELLSCAEADMHSVIKKKL